MKTGNYKAWKSYLHKLDTFKLILSHQNNIASPNKKGGLQLINKLKTNFELHRGNIKHYTSLLCAGAMRKPYFVIFQSQSGLNRKYVSCACS